MHSDHHNRKIAAMLADTLAPLIKAHLAEAATPRQAADDTEIVEAAKKVAAAVTKVQQTRYTRAEIHARAALERAAVALKAQLKARSRHGRA